MELQKIIARLTQLDNNRFPRGALRAAIDQFDESTPELLGILENVLLDPQKHRHDPKMDLLFAIYLLAQFREQRAYPLICQIASLPDDGGEIVSDLLGDVVTEDLANILASVSGGDTAPLKAIVENPAIYPYTRSASLRALTVLMYEGLLPRDELVAYYLSLFQGGLSRNEDPFIWAVLIRACCDIHPEECYDEIRKAYEEDIVENFFIGLINVEDALNEEKNGFLASKKEHHCFFNDTITHLETWNCFKPPKCVVKKRNKLGKAAKKRQNRRKKR